MVEIGVFIARVINARARGLLRLRPADGPTRLECLREHCGLCCSTLGGTRVEVNELPDLVQIGAVEVRDGELCLRRLGPRCVLLDGSGCSAYEHRPKGCREYPWYNVGGQIFIDKGCPGIRHDWDERPDPNSLRLIEEYYPLPRVLQRLLLWVIRSW